MGNREPDVEFEAAKNRINCALETLRTELRALQNQDLALLKQLLYIHHNINALSGRRDMYRRSYSSSSLAPQWDPSPSPPQLLSPVRKSFSGHMLLSRVQSEPICEAIAEGDEDEVEDPIDDEDDWLSQSFSGLSTKTTLYNDNGCELKSEMTDLLSPLPAGFGRKRALSSSDSTSQLAPPTPTSRTQVHSWHGGPPHVVLPQYSLSYETLLKRSIEAWKNVQKDKEENGIVDRRKMATLKLFL